MCLNVNIGNYHAMVALPLMASPLGIITVLMEPSPVMGLKLDAIISVENEVPDGCSMKCHEDGQKALMENPKRNPWPPPNSGEHVLRRWEMGLVRSMPLWSPLIQVKSLACVQSDNGNLFIGLVVLSYEMIELDENTCARGMVFLHFMTDENTCATVAKTNLATVKEDELFSVLELYESFSCYNDIVEQNMPSRFSEKFLQKYGQIRYWDCALLTKGDMGNYDQLELLMCMSMKWIQLVLCTMLYRRIEWKLLIDCNSKQCIESFLAILDTKLLVISVNKDNALQGKASNFLVVWWNASATKELAMVMMGKQLCDVSHGIVAFIMQRHWGSWWIIDIGGTFCMESK